MKAQDTQSLGLVELSFNKYILISHLAQVTHFLVLDVLVDVTDHARCSSALSHD